MQKAFLTAVTSVAMILGVITFAENSSAQPENAAIINSNFKCYVLDAHGGLVSGNANNHSVITSSDNTTLICMIKGVPNNTGKTVHFQGFGCYTHMGFTRDTREKISPNGSAVLTCRVNHQHR